MDPIASVVDKFKGFAKSSEDFLRGFLGHTDDSSRRNPIEILKRLQREAFSDLMKLRDRQEKVERMISFYGSSKGSPFRETKTHVRGEIDVVGAFLMVERVDQQNCVVVRRSGIRTGISSRFTFETTIGEKDTLIAEFVANQRGEGSLGDVLGSPLSLAKVIYTANISDWISAVAIPVGGRCKDFGIAAKSSLEEKGLTDFSSYGPPLMNQHNGSAIGIMVRKSNIAASLAQFVTIPGMQPSLIGINQCFSTFGQVVYQMSRATKLSLLGLHQTTKSSGQQNYPGALNMPLCIFMPRRAGQLSREAESNISEGSIGIILESELDDSTRIGGWVEMKNSNLRYLQWTVMVSDTPENELGWGLSVGGSNQGPVGWDHFQVEAFLNLNLGKRFSIRPGLLYVTDGSARVPALMLHSSCSL